MERNLMRWHLTSSDPMEDKNLPRNTPRRPDRRVFSRVRFWNTFFLMGFVCLAMDIAQAQDLPRRTGSRVIDDTTRQVYGPRTSTYYHERDFFFNRPVLNPIDTVIHNYHRNSNYVQKNENLYQDLGNIGTAI